MAETGYAGTELGDWGFMPTDPDALAAELTKRGLHPAGRVRARGAEGPGQPRARRRVGAEGGTPAACRGRSHHRLRRHSVAPFPGAGRQQRLRSRAHQERGPRDRGDGTDATTSGRSSQPAPNWWPARSISKPGCALCSITTARGMSRPRTRSPGCSSLTDPTVLGLVLRHRALRFCGRGLYGRGDGLQRFAIASGISTSRTVIPRSPHSHAPRGGTTSNRCAAAIFCELGKGCVDFPTVPDGWKRRPDLTWGIVEQDVLPGMGKPMESARRNREYLRSIGL